MKWQNEPHKYWPSLKQGNASWAAGAMLPMEVILTLEHGRFYTREELGLTGNKLSYGIGVPERFQFIAERLLP